jgi:hypothetical protein
MWKEIKKTPKRKEKIELNYYKALRTLIAGYGIKLGDTVVVDHKPSTCECVGWTINWCSNMDKYIGIEGIVFELGRDNGISVTFESGENYSFPVFCLRTIRSADDEIDKAYEILQKYSALKIGDIVQVIRSNEQGELGCACYSSDSTKTKKEAVESSAIGEIIKMNPRSIRVKFGKCDWTFPYFALRKMEPELKQLETRYFSDGKDITNEISKGGLEQIEKNIVKTKKTIAKFKKNLVDITVPAAKLRASAAGRETPPINRSIMDMFGGSELIEILNEVTNE